MNKSVFLIGRDSVLRQHVGWAETTYTNLYLWGEFQPRPKCEELTEYFRQASKGEVISPDLFLENPMLHGMEEVRFFQRGPGNIWAECDESRPVGYYEMALVDGNTWCYAPRVFEALGLESSNGNWYSRADLAAARAALCQAA